MQPDMFPDGDDLPLFTGALVSPTDKPFVPKQAHKQPSLLDIRLDPFHTREEPDHDTQAID
jgi:hypothetical protein